MAQFLAPIINDQQEDANGNPLSGGTIEVHLAGTSTPATTYSDKAGLTANTWPITLNTLGVNSQGAVWLTGGSAYKYTIKNAAGVTQRTIDNVSGINDTTVTTDQWVVFQGTPTYVSATSFTVPGDQTQILQPGRRIRTVNTGGAVFSTITSSVFSAPNTTIRVVSDSGALDSGISTVFYGIISVLDTSIPGGTPIFGQCRLKVSGGNAILSAYQGNRLTINGAIYSIPASSIGLAPTGLTPGTLYFIYAYINAGVVSLEASTTGHSTDAATGVEIKTGDASRTLVGMARPIAGPTFVDSPSQRFTISWFNRRGASCSVSIAVTQTTGSLTPVSLAFAEFLSWGGEAITSNLTGGMSNNTINAINLIAIGLDSGTVSSTPPGYGQSYAAGGFSNFSLSYAISVGTEGYHFIAAQGWVNSGTGSFLAGNTVSAVVNV